MPSVCAIQIAGTGSVVPEHVIPTDLIGALIEGYAPGRGAAWAIERLGVYERRFAGPLDPTTGRPLHNSDELSLAFAAASAATARAGIDPEDLDGLWYVSCTQSETQRHFSRMALALHARLGLRAEAFAFEMDAGCGGALHAIAAATMQMRGGNLKNVLIVAANQPSQYFEHWETYAEAGAWLPMYLFGDGAGALVLHQMASDQPTGILASYTGCDTKNPLMTFERTSEAPEPIYLIDARAVALGFRAYARGALAALRSRYHFDYPDVDRFYFHQVNAVVLRNFVGELGIPEHKVAIHVDRYGNLASAATLVLLDEDLRSGRVSQGSLCVLCTVGAGAQFGALLVRL